MSRRRATINLKTAKSRAALTITHPNAAGIDIGRAAHFVAVPPDRDDTPVREFPSFTVALNALPSGSQKWLDKSEQRDKWKLWLKEPGRSGRAKRSISWSSSEKRQASHDACAGSTQGPSKPKSPWRPLREDKTMVQLCQEFDLHANQITEWKRQLLERAADVFGGADPPKPVDLQPLHAKIGQLTLENDFLERALTKAGLLSAR